MGDMGGHNNDRAKTEERAAWPASAILLLFQAVHILPFENGFNRGTFECSAEGGHLTVRAEKGDFGHITSTQTPTPAPANTTTNLTDDGGRTGEWGEGVGGGGGWCEVTIDVCSTCKIRLTFLTLAFPACNGTERRQQDQHSQATIYNYHCIPGCDYLHVNEVVYPYNRATHASFHATDTGTTFKSISSQVKLRHCFAGAPTGKSFSVEFVSLDKNELHQGMVSPYRKSVGVVRAPNFPDGYAFTGETFTYMIQNLDPYGHVRLVAIDWDIAPESEVKIYDGFGENAPLLALGRFDRPVLMSQSNTLVLVFSTGAAARHCCFHTGFKIHYEFVSDTSWPQKPVTACSSVWAMQDGGLIDFTGAATPGLYDCVWVIKRQSRDNTADGVVLRLTEVLLGDGWLQYGRLNTLDILSGPTSESPVLYRFTARNLTHAPPSYFSPHGLFVRLRGGFYSTDKLSFIFTAVKNVSSEGTGCPGMFDYLCHNLLCIAQGLVCDGIDHCGDQSDETPDMDCSMSALWRHSFEWSMPYVAAEPPASRTTVCSGFSCRADRRCLATSMLCDGLPDCVDGEDERYCYTTTEAYSAACAHTNSQVAWLLLGALVFTVQGIHR